jgi:hypothetical protein
VTRVRCLRTLPLVPVLYVNQEMVLRLGAVTGVGHARLILERFGKFWGAFSVIDLFLLNALTIVTGCVRTEVWPAARPAAVTAPEVSRLTADARSGGVRRDSAVTPRLGPGS